MFFSMTSGHIARTRVGMSQRVTCRMVLPTVFNADESLFLLLFWQIPKSRVEFFKCNAWREESPVVNFSSSYIWEVVITT